VGRSLRSMWTLSPSFPKVGHKIVIDESEIVLKRIDVVCIHALSFFLHYALVLERGADIVELVLSTSTIENTDI